MLQCFIAHATRRETYIIMTLLCHTVLSYQIHPTASLSGWYLMAWTAVLLFAFGLWLRLSGVLKDLQTNIVRVYAITSLQTVSSYGFLSWWNNGIFRLQHQWSWNAHQQCAGNALSCVYVWWSLYYKILGHCWNKIGFLCNPEPLYCQNPGSIPALGHYLPDNSCYHAVVVA